MKKILRNVSNTFKKGGNKFDPSVHRFPEIRVDHIASELRLAERGHADGEKNFPVHSSTSKTPPELDAIERVSKLRAAALNNFETELESYASRIASVKEEGEHISLLVGKAKSEIITKSNEWENALENPRENVFEQQKKLKKFQVENGIEGPPKEAGGLLTIAAAMLLAVIELVINAYFFAEENPMGYLGGIAIAAAIAFVNVFGSGLLGFFSRFKNMNKIPQKFVGWLLVVIFVAFASGINLAVAHLRSALESNAWDVSLIIAISTLKDSPLGIHSFSAWLVVGFGAIVSFFAFWKAHTFFDPYPGYNRVWQDCKDAIDEYAEIYSEAHEELTEMFESASDNLKQEVEKRRHNMKSATDAYIGRSSLVRNFEVFLDGCNGAANKLLSIYRDANAKARTEPAPQYFGETYSFETYKIPRFDKKEDDLANDSQAEIDKIEQSVKTGVEEILKVRESALSVFPTVRQIKRQQVSVEVVEQQYKEA